MIKYLILFIHLVGLSFYQMIFGDVTVTQKVPNNIKSGEDVVVEITVNKDGVGGFAKVQQVLPDGFTAEVVESKGATFSYKDNIVKFIWMALPSENEFKVSYKLKITETLEGDFSIGGKFSFIDNNERKNIEITESLISVSKEELASNNEEIPVEESAPEVEEVTPVEPVAGTILEESTTADEVVLVKITTAREVEKLDNDFVVKVKFTQENLDGFAKLVETVPNGFTAEAKETKGGVFSFKENEVKILWMAAPKDAEFEVEYILKPSGETNGEQEISGSFSYLENDVTQKYILNSSTFAVEGTIESEPLVEETPTVEEVEPVAETVVEEQPVIEETTPEVSNDPEPVAEESTPTPKETPSVTSIPNPETGVTYKVQVGAGHQKVPSNYFVNKFNLSENIATESHNGWIKYVTGKFDVYKEARDKRNKVRNNIKTAFVTAYNEGKRITVQEALMISNQKWYK